MQLLTFSNIIIDQLVGHTVIQMFRVIWHFCPLTMSFTRTRDRQMLLFNDIKGDECNWQAEMAALVIMQPLPFKSARLWKATGLSS